MTISDEDRKAFEAATAGVKRLPPKNQAVVEPPHPAPRAAFARAARKALLEQSLNGPFTNEIDEEVAFRRDAVTQRSFRRLGRGEYALEAEIDLHGMRLAEAKAALRDFISECLARRIACVRVIHGKGTRSGPDGPILKPSVHHWLSRWDRVLAFVSAQPRHGGSGAVYVLLKR